MRIPFTISFLSILVTLTLATNAAYAEPVRLLPKSAGTLYFARSYSKKHLSAHPDQWKWGSP